MELVDQNQLLPTPPTPPSTLQQSTDEFTDEEFKDAIKQIQKFIQNIEDNYENIAKLLARMNRYQRKDVKGMLGKLISTDHLTRLYLYGKGEFPKYLAFRTQSLKVSTWENLPLYAKTYLRNPDHQIEIMTYKKATSPHIVGTPEIKIVKLINANSLELASAFNTSRDKDGKFLLDPKKGFVPPEKQFLLKEKYKSKIVSNNLEVMKSVAIYNGDPTMLKFEGDLSAVLVPRHLLDKIK